MAIIIEEEKNNSNTPAILGWLILAVVIAVSAYYLFFAAPPAVVVTPPPNFANIAPIAQLNFDPTQLINSPAFQALVQSVPEATATGPAAVGRPNPFVAP